MFIEGQGLIRFVDLCAGIGGFHLGLLQAVIDLGEPATKPDDGPRRGFSCVMASDIDESLRSLYVSNFPSIVEGYRELFPVDDARRVGLDLYDDQGVLARVHGDVHGLLESHGDHRRLRQWPEGTRYAGMTIIPDHELLCAGFPCQPFSKSGDQPGFEDDRGTVFDAIAVILQEKRPRYVLLENVGNFARHDRGRTWRRVHGTLTRLGYQVRATEHVLADPTGRRGLLSPHHLGYPHHRERFFIVAQHRSAGELLHDPLPNPFGRQASNDSQRAAKIAVSSQRAAEALAATTASSKVRASAEELRAAQLSGHRVRCVNLWNELLAEIAAQPSNGSHPAVPLPSFPIWGFELDPWNHYPFELQPPTYIRSNEELLQDLRTRVAAFGGAPGPNTVPDLLTEDRAFMATPLDDWGTCETILWRNLWPEYARRAAWPNWKIRFIGQNRAWARLLWDSLDARWLRCWLERLYQMSPSLQKLEWNCQGEPTDLWKLILQFRPSGLRAKRFQHVPSLVAMTTTQIPVVPRPPGEPMPGANPESRGRFLLPMEGLQLQGFPATWALPLAREAKFAALGNAVHVGVVSAIVQEWLLKSTPPADQSATEGQLAMAGMTNV